MQEAKDCIGEFDFEDSPYSALGWWEDFTVHICGTNTQFWLCLYENDKAICVLPLMENFTGGAKALQGISNFYTAYFKPLSDGPSPREEDLVELFSRSEQFLQQYDTLDLFPLTPDVMETLKHSLERAGYFCYPYRYSVNWRQTDIEDFQQYWSTRPRRLRQTIMRKRKRVDNNKAFRFDLFVSRDTDKALADYHKVYFESWKVVEPFPRFIDAVVTRAAADQSLRLGIVYHDDLPVSAQIWLVRNEKAYIFKLAYDPAYADMSVGSLLSAWMTEHVIENDKVREIDFLTGDDDYKQDWMGTSRVLYGVQAIPGTSMRARYLRLRNQAAGFIYKLCGSRLPSGRN